MGMTFTIGSVSYEQLSTTDGRKAKEFDPGNLIYQIFRTHPPGTNGNLVIRGGRIGGKISCRMRYCGPTTTIYGQWETDRTSWENTAVEIIGPGGTTYSRCQLESASIVQMPRGKGSNKAYMEVQATFSVDG